MSQGGPPSPNWGGFGQQSVPPDPYSRRPPFPAGFGVPDGFDPVTGQPLPPGPAAYSVVDPCVGPGYPAAPGYPGSYEAAGPPGYGVPPGYPLVPTHSPRPGGAVAAAVLGYIQAGFVLMGAIPLFAGAAGSEFVGAGIGGELTAVAILAAIAGGLLIAGATMVLNRKPALMKVGAGLSILISVYFVVRLSDLAFSVLWLPVAYAVLPTLSVALSAGRDVRSWVRAGTYEVG